MPIFAGARYIIPELLYNWHNIWTYINGTIAFLPLVGSYPRVLPLLFELAQFCPYFFPSRSLECPLTV